jgi:hypothetical protein
MTKLLLVSIATLAISASAQAAIAYDFNTSQADFNSKFTNNAVPGAGYTWQSTGGVGTAPGSGRVNGNATQTFAYYNDSLGQFVNSGDMETVSVYFLTGADNPASGNNYVGIGSNTAAATPGGSAGFQAGISTQAGTGTDPALLNHNLRIDYRNNAPGAGSQNDTTTFTLATGNWYQIELALTYQGTNNFAFAINLFNWGTDGTTGGGLVDSFTGTQALSSQVGVNVFGGFAATTRGGGGVRTLGVDNFAATAIPEPSTAITLLGGLGVLLGFRRRAA